MRAATRLQFHRVGLLGGPILASLAPARAGPARAKGPVSEETLVLGRELFARQWVPNDSRSYGGDGLGPVYNERSCLDCHHQGGRGTARGPTRTSRSSQRPATRSRTRAHASDASARRSRTGGRPLWGLADSGPYLHDGRTETIDDAIRRHRGQASTAAQRCAQLSARERRHLEAFLLSLAAPGPEPVP